jgi:hypothetical protein
VREEYMREERGLGKKGLIGFSYEDDMTGDEAEVEAMRQDWKYEEEENICKERSDKEGARKARDRRVAAKKLYRVEILYVS